MRYVFGGGRIGLVAPINMSVGVFGSVVVEGYSEKNKTILILGLDIAIPHQ